MFWVCSSLESIEIPSSVSSIGEYAFGVCYELTEVYSYIAEPFAINSNVFSATTKENAILYVPQGTLDLYKEADGWKEFANIVEMSIGDIEQISSESAVSDVYNLNGQKADAFSGINIIRTRHTRYLCARLQVRYTTANAMLTSISELLIALIVEFRSTIMLQFPIKNIKMLEFSKSNIGIPMESV